MSEPRLKSVYEVLVKPGTVDFDNPDRAFVQALQLARMANQLRSNHRLRYIDERSELAKETRFRLRTELLLRDAAMLAETLNKLKEIFRTPESMNEVAEELKTELMAWLTYLEGDSIVAQTCFLIRNKVQYHFDEVVVREGLRAFVANYDESTDDIIFARGASDSKLDLYFALADDIVFNYLLMKMGNPDPGDFFEELEVDGLKATTDLSSFLETLSASLLSDRLNLDHTPETDRS